MATVDYSQIEQRMRDGIEGYDEKLAVEKAKLELQRYAETEIKLVAAAKLHRAHRAAAHPPDRRR